MTSERHGITTDPTIATIGHSNLSAEEFVAALKAHQIATLVDVRSAPYSRWAPQFNRDDLARTLRLAGVEYRFAGDVLGGRPTDPTCYKNGELPGDKADFLALVDYGEVAKRDWYRAGITRLIELAEGARTAIMCSEEDPARCHRHHLIAQTLLDAGVSVEHIRKDGRVERAARRQVQHQQQLGLF